ncbi:response regulator [Cytobacillus gottheilii]|uniref:response regulator n=1 Tax=Cytobacillus gottheilii TaxID=859144 RepID=UPI0009B9A1FA|nr:response regulator [Cytobacillus gottheilii]
MIKVIIAEDDYRVARIHEEFIEKIDGVEVTGKALNAQATLNLLEEKSADLLIMDIYMPDRLGSSLLPEIREKYPNVDVIMISASNEKDQVEQSLRNGVIDYIIKPVSFERFVMAIQEYKKKKSLLNQKNELDQEMIDHFFRRTIQTAIEEKLPKGIDPLTLSKVKGILQEKMEGMNAVEIGSQMGASRTTARRYLEYLVSTGEASAELEYGIVGRPERKYYME